MSTTRQDIIKALALIGVLVGLLVFFTARAQQPTDFTYVIPITVSNNTGATLDDSPVAIPIQVGALVDGVYINAFGTDLLFTNSGGTELVHGLAQDVSVTSTTTWWAPVNSLPSGALTTVNLYMGAATTTNPQYLRLYGTSELVTVTDAASLDVTTNLTVESQDTVSGALPASGDVYLLRKAESYTLGLTSTTSAFWRVTAGSSTENLLPNAMDTTGITTEVGCAAGSHHLCGDDPVGAPDDDTTWVRNPIGGSASEEDIYELAASAIPTDSVITSVTVHWRSRLEGGTANATPSLCFTSCATRTTGTPFSTGTSYTDQSETLARPGGGSWAIAALADLEVAMDLTEAGTGGHRLTQVYVSVAYIPATTLTYSPITAGTEYDIRGTYDGVNMALLINDVEQATAAVTGAVNVTTANVLIGSGAWNVSIGRSRIGGTSTTTPTYVLDLDYEPSQITQTQVGNAGNSWNWLGTITDQSASTNNGAYTFVRDSTGITVTSGPLTAANNVSIISATETFPTAFGGAPVDDPLGDSFDESQAVAWPFSIITSQSPAGIPVSFLMLTLAAVLGIMAGFAAYAGTKMPAAGLIASGLVASIIIYMGPVANVIVLLIVISVIALLVLLPRPFEAQA